MGMGGSVIVEIVKAYLKSIARFVSARWISPRDTPETDQECAVMEIDLDLTPDALNFLGAFLLLLAKYDPRVNTDHKVFEYLGQQSQKRKNAEVTFLISLKRRETAARGKSQTDNSQV